MSAIVLQTTSGPVVIEPDGASGWVYLGGRLVGHYTQMRELRVRVVPQDGRPYYVTGYAEAAERLAEGSAR